MSKSLICLGDVHARWEQLSQIIAAVPRDSELWQLGDMGLTVGHPCYWLVSAQSLKFIRGNNDDPEVARRRFNYAGDFGYRPEHNLFFVSGAAFFERNMRKPWSPHEELDNEALDAAYRFYVEAKPEIVFSHTAPAGVGLMLAKDTGKTNTDHQSRTAQMLHKMLMAHQPRFWIFAHFHVAWEKVFTTHSGKATQFVCCDRLRDGQDAKLFLLPAEINAPKIGELSASPLMV